MTKLDASDISQPVSALAANTLTTRQVATVLHLHPETVKRLARCGQIPSRKCGKKRLFWKPTLEAWLSKRP